MTWRVEMFEERVAIMDESGFDGKKALVAASQDTAEKYWERVYFLQGPRFQGWSLNKIERFQRKEIICQRRTQI
jgi:hypothetical protein